VGVVVAVVIVQMLLLSVMSVFASPEPCEKFDGAAYDKCVDNLSRDENVTIKEEDVDKNEERMCGASRSAEGMKACLAESQKKTMRRAKERELQERQSNFANKINPKKTPKRCEASAVINTCQQVHRSTQKILSNPENDQKDRRIAVQSCLEKCTTVTPSTSVMLSGCNRSEKDDVQQAISDNHRTCSVPGSSAGAAKQEPSKEDKMKAWESASQAADSMAINEDGMYDPSSKPRIEEVQHPVMGASYCVQGKDLCFPASNPDQLYNPSDNIVDNTVQPSLESYYKNNMEVQPAPSSLSAFDNYADEFSARAVPIPATAPRPPVVPGVNDSPAPVIAEPARTYEKPVEQKPTAQEAAPKTATKASSGSATTSGGAQQQASGYNGGGASNPFANTNFSAVAANAYNKDDSTSNSAKSSDVYSGTASNLASNSSDEGVGGGRRSYSGSDDSAGQSSPFRGTARVGQGGVGGSEGVNRDSGINVASTSGQSSNTQNGIPLDRKNNGNTIASLNSSQFQQGFHKASGNSGGLGVSLLSQQKKEQKKKRLRRIKAQCKGDLQCIAEILGGGVNSAKSRRGRGGRGLASVPGQLPKGVWKGYEDILSHMAKVHNKMDLDHSGEINLEE
jgi:hypothetical protein